MSEPEPDLEGLGSLGSLLDEELGQPAPKPALPRKVSPTDKPCPSCNTSLPESAVLCVACGYDLAEGKKRTTQTASTGKPKKAKKGLLAGGTLLRGILFCGIGALLGAFTWALVAVLINRELGFIAWAVGAAAGGGMAAGYDDKSDGTVPGIIAAFMALGGIFLGKILIVIFVILPLVAKVLSDTNMPLKREMCVQRLTDDGLAKRGTNRIIAVKATIEQERRTAESQVELWSDEEVEERYALWFANRDEGGAGASRGQAVLVHSGANASSEDDSSNDEDDAKEKASEQGESEQPGAAQANKGETNSAQADTSEDEVDDKQETESHSSRGFRRRGRGKTIDAAAQAEEFEGGGQSLVGAFFSTMFSPIDGLFILLAFFTAYKFGSGGVSDD